ncbi:uncharacterized protein LOC112201032 [Rosa chinensis]|uniref:uncharacterized protein LOC112201032 n=1 Tax=Rosa chinensis TaxID=74649 RepID=UPI000D090DF9|nr:uncharacterized protein LOC112201032 [Rosa chinensis]
MDLWIPNEEPAILPLQYNRHPGRPRTKRFKDASEKENEGPKLGRVQKSLRCFNCNQLGHNIKSCHRHLPPKTAAVKGSKKRKLNSGEASSSQPKGTKEPLKSKNELRAKAAKKAEAAKKKRDEKRATAKEARGSTPTRGRPLKAASNNGKVASSKGKAASAPQASQGSSRSYVRIRDNARNAGKWECSQG